MARLSLTLSWLDLSLPWLDSTQLDSIMARLDSTTMAQLGLTLSWFNSTWLYHGSTQLDSIMARLDSTWLPWLNSVWLYHGSSQLDSTMAQIDLPKYSIPQKALLTFEIREYTCTILVPRPCLALCISFFVQVTSRTRSPFPQTTFLSCMHGLWSSLRGEAIVVSHCNNTAV